VYLGEEEGLSGCGCGLGEEEGLSGMGITLPATNGSTATSVPWWQTAIQEISKIIPRMTTVPTYPTTLPTYPGTPPYTQSYPATYNAAPASSLPSWLFPALGVGALVLLSKRRR
jgi:MYXO-CTERM domain-containing protein